MQKTLLLILMVTMPFTEVLAQSPEERSQESNETEQPSLLSDLDSRLHSAAAGTEKKVIRRLINEGADINSKDIQGRTPLLVAIEVNPKSSISKLLIKEGADVSVVDQEGNTAMHYAVVASAGKPPQRIVNGSSIIKALDRAGAPLNSRNVTGKTPRDLLLDQTQFRTAFGKYANGETARRARLGTLEDSLIKKGILDNRTYQSQKLSFGRLLNAAVSGQIGGGSGQVRGQSSAARPGSAASTTPNVQARPIKCQPILFENLTEDQGSAIVYAINQDLRDIGRSLPEHCIQKIVANSKVPFRGDTLVKYRIYRIYPRGYRTKCLGPVPDQKRDYWAYYEHTTQCNQFIYSVSGGKPIEVGGVRYEDGETAI